MAKSTIPCTHYSRGACMRGDSCHFAHVPSTAARTATICGHFVRGTCRYGTLCTNLHPPSSPSSKNHTIRVDDPKAGAPAKTTPCVFYNGLGCNKGTSCPFLHEDSSSSQAASHGSWRRSSTDVPKSSEPPATRTSCRFYVAGTCTKGDSCGFSHANRRVEHPPPKDIAEPNWRSVVVTPPPPPLPLQVEPLAQCKYFVSGTCLKGEGCTFVHELKPRVAPKDTSAAADTVEERCTRMMLHCKVEFGDGASIREVSTAFESNRVILSNLSIDVDQTSLIALLESFGDIANIVLERPTPGSHPIARIEMGKCTQAARVVSDLHGHVDQGSKMSAALDLRGVESGVGTTSSRKVKVSWYGPSMIAWAHFPTITAGRKEAKALDGSVVGGRTVNASFQTPTARQRVSFTVELKGLPVNVSHAQIRRLTGSSSVDIGRPSYDRQTGIREVELLLRSFGPLDSFQVLPSDQSKVKITAFAQFSTSDAAVASVQGLRHTKPPFLRESPIWGEQLHSIKYNIPSRQHELVRERIDALSVGLDQQTKIRVYDRDEMGIPVAVVCIRLFSADAKSLGKVKVAVEDILLGERLPAASWDSLWETIQGTVLLEQLDCYVKCDRRTRSLTVFGSRAQRDHASQCVQDLLEQIRSQRHVLPVEGETLRIMITGGLQALQGELGDCQISMDVVARTVTVRGNDADVGRARRFLLAAGTGHAAQLGTGGDCPVCFCEPSDPVVLSCSHTFCRDCLQHLLRAASGSEFTPLKCVAEVPYSGHSKKTRACGSAVPCSLLRDLLEPADETAVLEAAFQQHIRSQPDKYRYCPTPDCQVVYRPGVQGTVFHCPACLIHICASCHVENHEGLSCGEHQDNASGGLVALQQWRDANGVKPCPKCRIDIEKAGGCNHMTCGNCKTHICWVCMRTFEDEDSGGGVYAHMQREHGGFGG